MIISVSELPYPELSAVLPAPTLPLAPDRVSEPMSRMFIGRCPLASAAASGGRLPWLGSKLLMLPFSLK
jgi:hypothetical protein